MPIKIRRRSPNYPSINLEEAIDFINKIYKIESSLPVDREVAAKHMGFSSLSGHSSKILGSLLQFGLLEKLPDSEVRVSDLGTTILIPESDKEKEESTRESFDNPTLFRELNQQFEGMKPSPGNLRSQLVKKGYMKKSVDLAADSYLESKKYIMQNFAEDPPIAEDIVQMNNPGDSGLQAESNPQAERSGNFPKPVSSVGTASEILGSMKQDVFSLDEGSVTVIWPSAISQESYEDVKDWFDILARKIGRSVVK